MRQNRCSAFLAVHLAAWPLALAAQQTPSAEGAAFLLLPVGARSVALGQAVTADAGTAEALFWNPAGLATLPRSEFAFHHHTAFFGIADAASLSFVVQGAGTFSVGAFVVDYGDFPVTPGGPGGGPQPIGQITTRNIALLASYAAAINGRFQAGISYKLAQLRVECSGECSTVPTTTGTTHAVDLGAQLVVPAAFPVVIGAAVRNLGFKLQVNNQAQADPLPTRLQLGVSMVLLRPSAGAGRLDLRVLADVQGPIGSGGPGDGQVTLVGLESGAGESVRLRAGYSFSDGETRGPSFGIGLKVGSITLDLARVFYASDALAEREPVHVSMRVAF